MDQPPTPTRLRGKISNSSVVNQFTNKLSRSDGPVTWTYGKSMSVDYQQTDFDSDFEARWLEPRRNPRRLGRRDELEAQLARLKERMNVAVIFGGDKRVPNTVIYQTPNTRSWKSYETVAQDIAGSLDRLGFKSVHILADNMNLGNELRARDIHFAWLNSGGIQGYNPMAHTSSMLEMYGVPYVGHDPLMSSILDNKPCFKREISAFGVKTSPFFTWHFARGPFDPASNAVFQSTFADYDGPYVVKPVSGRASLHVHVVDDVADLPAALKSVFHATQNGVLVERFLSGREFCIAVAGPVTARGRQLHDGTKPFVFSPIERVLDSDEQIFTSMDVKPISTDRVKVLRSDDDAEIVSRLEEIALSTFINLNIETLIRLDLRMSEDGEIYVLEANPKPDLKKPDGKKTSIVCTGLDQFDMDYDDLILSLIADRIDQLFCQRRGTVHHLLALLESA